MPKRRVGGLRHDRPSLCLSRRVRHRDLNPEQVKDGFDIGQAHMPYVLALKHKTGQQDARMDAMPTGGLQRIGNLNMAGKTPDFQGSQQYIQIHCCLNYPSARPESACKSHRDVVASQFGTDNAVVGGGLFRQCSARKSSDAVAPYQLKASQSSPQVKTRRKDSLRSRSHNEGCSSLTILGKSRFWRP